MSVAQTFFTLGLLTIGLCWAFSYLWKNDKLFEKLLLALLFGIILGFGYKVTKEKIENAGNAVEISTVVTSCPAIIEDSFSIVPTLGSSTSVVRKVDKASLDLLSKVDTIVLDSSIFTESQGFKTKQLKIRCAGIP